MEVPTIKANITELNIKPILFIIEKLMINATEKPLSVFPKPLSKKFLIYSIVLSKEKYIE
ncbi:hypothetical protein D3C76_1813460 [compost metagenome]